MNTAAVGLAADKLLARYSLATYPRNDFDCSLRSSHVLYEQSQINPYRSYLRGCPNKCRPKILAKQVRGITAHPPKLGFFLAVSADLPL